MAGEEDENIQLSFIENQTSESDLMTIRNTILNSGGIRYYGLLDKLNLSRGTIDKCLKVLEVRDFIYKDGREYFATAKPFKINYEKENIFKEVQLQELNDVKEFIKTNECYMKYIAEKLSDNTATECGRCSNCLDTQIVNTNVNQESINQAINYLNSMRLDILPRKKLPNTLRLPSTNRNYLEEKHINEVGKVISIYGDTGYGQQVKKEKYVDKRFSDEMVDLAANYIMNKWTNVYREVKWITCIPSYKNENLVEDFTKRLSYKLNLPFKLAIIKTRTNRSEQKSMQNDLQQYINADTSFDVDSSKVLPSSVLLVDDIVDSRMSFTVCGIKLKENGSGNVYPFALASSSKGGLNKNNE